MLLHCPGKRCNTTKPHLLKVDGNIVVCMDCGEDNLMVSDFMKSAMKSNGDIYRSVAARKAFMYKCPKCTVDRSVKIVDEKALCDTCLHPLNLSAPMIEAIKTSRGSKNDDSGIVADETEPKEVLAKGIIKRRK